VDFLPSYRSLEGAKFGANDFNGLKGGGAHWSSSFCHCSSQKLLTSLYHPAHCSSCFRNCA
jgi:hypothetical protein